ncbi:DUF4381 domain-containing protein [Phyllobacterium sp. 21LDTY02-6]|uniref:DUF4381 family protein n=1 Tax=Phyllobacterium sp. 21LDTY02-6 TaxID=2944903 RepID=UPI00202274DC|nr:DUF4381 family protein [Phyllobacterium sp. 21LDTY02-6]MCO4319329.1 DUF4381 domain-containing protein [Phyllobacterium sp. 21LDTY02-6]
MADTADPLNALQAIRLPAVPASLLWEQMAVALLAGAITAIIIQMALAYRNRRKAASLEQRFIAAIDEVESLGDDERLAAQASLMRGYVKIVAGDGAARKQGEDWLEELDNLFRTEFFRKGNGRVLLDGLYSRQPPFGSAELGATLRELLQGRRS